MEKIAEDRLRYEFQTDVADVLLDWGFGPEDAYKVAKEIFEKYKNVIITHVARI